ncbi:PHD finger protein 21B isoform X2 [Gouania willdenowi]|nr:PHD finger protein 21B isoform X2 [Gouania willdenowi]
MVTAHINGQKSSEQTVCNNTITTQHKMLGTLTAVPIKVPQVSSLHRLVGPAVTVLPQVRPKTQIPDSLPPPGPCGDLQPLSLQRATAVLSPRSQGATLPPDQPSGGGDSSGPAQHPSTSPGVAYAIIAASPANGNGVSAVSEAVKVIIIQPQTPSSTEGTPGSPPDAPTQDASPALSSSPQRKDKDPEKIAFMVALGLVTTEHLEEIQTKRQERKRRSTANPAYSGLFEPERKRLASHYLSSSLYLSAQDSEDFCWKEDLEHEDLCAVCKEDGELQLCHTCPRAFHPTCLQPPLRTPPRGPWYCPKCQKKVLNKENLSWPQNFVQSYVTHKTVRQEEKRRLMRRNSELKKEFVHLEEEDKDLTQTLQRCMSVRERLLSQQRDVQASLCRLQTLVRLIRSDQPVAMTTPWDTPTSTASIQCQDGVAD